MMFVIVIPFIFSYPRPQGRVVVPPASTLIINDIRESSPTGGTSTSGVQVRGMCVCTLGGPALVGSR